ncbi:hypothetical protein A2W13_02310 [Candidatus Woesebacteria bacterium RBG_16_36_11]|uniref:EfeO-type cupredoxin-like domain-containing protein n=2 Tax=Candidatus Woeseibacteriota TaxID=1752722 RepID=A0A1F7X946_9BACT|nr:MAG: hypothetical protein A2W13_02310 [Candidatus Woesebacteria bacterium RBG_16_36_11]OGM16244.1 MAG: hypothetical protein A2V55_00955 [Candidatus Woesebacteria bacterium RBG_19FT_COMBO_37_29]
MEEVQNIKKKGMGLTFIAGVIIVALMVVIGLYLIKSKSEAAQTVNEANISGVESNIPNETVSTITVEGGNYYFNPNEIRVKKGEPVRIILNSVDGIAHNLVIDEFNVTSETISSDETTQVEFTPDKTGTFEFYCSIDGHRAMGMKGTLIVE